MCNFDTPFTYFEYISLRCARVTHNQFSSDISLDNIFLDLKCVLLVKNNLLEIQMEVYDFRVGFDSILLILKSPRYDGQITTLFSERLMRIHLLVYVRRMYLLS